MINVTVHGPSGTQFKLDTPDPALIGPWLMSLFQDIKPMGRIPMHFRIEIYGP